MGPVLFVFYIVSLFTSCENNEPVDRTEDDEFELSSDFILGADLSYVNEMLDCGAVYLNESGQKDDPYKIFADYGTDLVRVRLWHTPDWTEYSDLDDVTLALTRARAHGMQVLLDFHYSDDWTDPGKQKIPAAWLDVVDNQTVLGDSLYNYTSYVLNHLLKNNLVPEYVQVGNEINAEILQDPSRRYNSINWTRNSYLINKGIQAVRDFATGTGNNVKVMLHIAQPENAIWWFDNATKNGITDFDLIGLSYYPLWSSYKLDNLPEAINTLSKYDKNIMVVETAYPFTLNNADGANNILGSDALIDGFPASETGQFGFLEALVETLDKAGAKGMIYWEPAWVSTNCRTQWGQGSHWDNATLFNQAGGVNKGMEIYRK